MSTYNAYNYDGNYNIKNEEEDTETENSKCNLKNLDHIPHVHPNKYIKNWLENVSSNSDSIRN